MEAELINRIVELDIDMEGFDDSELEELGVDVISLVEEPAIGIDFQYFNKTDDLKMYNADDMEFRKNSDCPDGFEHQMPDGKWMCGKEHNSSTYKALPPLKGQSFSIDEDKRIATGPLMIPDKMILRRDEDGEPYYIYFTKDTIRRMAEKFLRLNKHNNTDVEHDFNITTSNTLLESWITEDIKFDKAYKMGFELPIGTWVVSYKVNDDESWDKIKSGELKGFSLAGPFIEKMAKSQNRKFQNEKLVDDIKSVLSKVDDNG
tara:strand:+ start:181 stop:963 length:783 start_codon:yes stop_codon:yes gene_type:complete